jgi:adenylate kinase
MALLHMTGAMAFCGAGGLLDGPLNPTDASLYQHVDGKHKQIKMKQCAREKPSGKGDVFSWPWPWPEQPRRTITRIKIKNSNMSRARVIALSGPPASGKGTQCELVATHFHFVHVSVGDLLRSHAKFVPQLSHFINKGELVPDELTIGIVKSRLAAADCQRHGVILDGFPRTLAQAQQLEAAGVQVSSFVYLHLDDDQVTHRISGRRIDPVTGLIYHLQHRPPPVDVAARCVQVRVCFSSKVKLALLHKR